MEESISEMGKDAPYDLRQVYAIEILGEHLKDIARARKSDNFPMYFKCLKDLYIVVQHKFKSKESKYTLKNEKGIVEEKRYTPKEYYSFLMNRVAILANKHSSDWLGTTKTPEPYAAIEEALNDVEMFLYDKIEDAKLFGSAKLPPGL